MENVEQVQAGDWLEREQREALLNSTAMRQTTEAVGELNRAKAAFWRMLGLAAMCVGAACLYWAVGR